MQKPYISYWDGKPGPTSRLFKMAEEKNLTVLRGKTIEENRLAKQKLAEVRPVPHNVLIESVLVYDIPCEWIRKKGAKREKVVVYIHGGSWATGNLDTARPVGVLLAELTEYSVLVVDYRLAPEHPYPAGLEDCYKVYCGLLDSGFLPGNIAFMGDSAGGNLALCLTYKLKIENRRMPGAIVCASPVPDLTPGSALWRSQSDLLFTMHNGTEQDVFTLYAGSHERSMPTISPKFGDLAGFPPILIHVGESEPLCDDCIAFSDVAHAAGVNISCRVWRDMFHDFSIVGVALKESRLSLREMAQMIQQHLDKKL